jgi:hypothetical protein
MSEPGADIVLEGDWGLADEMLDELANRALMFRAVDDVVAAEAKFAAKEIRRGIRTQAPGGKPFPPLAPSTLVSRQVAGISGSDRLIGSGTLMRSITSKKVGQGKHWAGVPNKVVAGRNLAQVAEMNERGSTIRQTVTKAMQGFLEATFDGAPALGSTITIRIPASPFIQPVFDAVFTGARVERRIRGRMTKRVNVLRGQ